MGQARQRAAQIAELKNTPKPPRKRRKLILFPTGQKPEGAVKFKTHVWHETVPQPKQLQPITLVVGRKLSTEDFMTHVMMMTQLNPKGFRQPSAKEVNYKSTSLMEKLAIRNGDMKARVAPERSKRGYKKLEAKQEAKAIIVLQRLLRDHPGKSERWYFGKVMAALNGNIGPTWLETEVKLAVGRTYLDPKYLHSAARKRLQGEHYYETMLADAKARQRGENIDGSPRRETIMQEAA